MSLYFKLEKNEIRLLALHPGTFHDNIKVSLYTASLFSVNLDPYKALSYVWGDQNITETITCNDFPIEITTNLALALRYIRSESHPCTIWADAICINQADLDERNSQVPLMEHIYPKADEVIIWIGEADESTENVMEWFREFDKHWEDETHRAELVYITQEAGFDLRLERVRAFVTRPWFHRAWTFQEACLSESAHVRCGSFTLPWLTFCSASIIVREMGIEKSAFGESENHVQALAYFSVMTRIGDSFQLSFLLNQTRSRIATNPRDKIYSLLGLVRNSSIKPDYGTSMERIYCTVAKTLITADKSLDILSGSTGYDTDSTLPSWVPDWRKGLSIQLICGMNHKFDSVSQFDVNLSMVEAVSPLQQDGELHELHIRGIQFATVLSVWRLDELSHRLKTCMTAERRVLEELRGLFKQIGIPDIYEHSNEVSIIAFLRTLSADSLPISKKVGVLPRKTTFPWHHDWLRQEIDIDLKTFRRKKIAGYFGIDSMEIKSKLQSTGLDMTDIICKVYMDFFSEDGSRRFTSSSRFQHKLDTLFGDTRPPPSYFFKDDVKPRVIVELADTILRWLVGRSFIMLDNGFMGIAPLNIESGDLVYILDGAKVPFALKPANTKPTHFKLLGECYIHGIMYGEVTQPKKNKYRRRKSFFRKEDIVII